MFHSRTIIVIVCKYKYRMHFFPVALQTYYYPVMVYWPQTALDVISIAQLRNCNILNCFTPMGWAHFYCCFGISQKGESISQPNPVNGTTSSPSYSSSHPSLTDSPLPGPVRGAESPAPLALPFGRALPLVASPSPHHSVTAVPSLEPPYSDLASQAPLAPPSSPGHALTQTTPQHRQLTCHQCSKQFDTKPLLFSYQVRHRDQLHTHILWFLS